jgi:hypothetical protein
MQGYVVLAVEHMDGTACIAKLPGAGGWKKYSGLGGKAGKFEKQHFRRAEIQMARKVLVALADGEDFTGIPRTRLFQALPESGPPCRYNRVVQDRWENSCAVIVSRLFIY